MSLNSERWQAIQARIRQAEQQSGRPAGAVSLLAVSKAQPAAAIREVFLAGQYSFGENYLQEALEKMIGLADLPLEWHFIGPIQSNKTRPIAENFSWVHSVERLKIAQRLSEARPPGLPPLQVCLQVNVSGEASKSGVAPEQAAELAHAVAGLPRLKLRGLMAIPAPIEEAAVQGRPFAMLRELMQTLNRQGLSLDSLSMGMSDDFVAAIGEGATLVRLGTAIFGHRRDKQDWDTA